MALMSRPSLLILDEPTTALDVTVEPPWFQLVKDLGAKYGTSMAVHLAQPSAWCSRPATASA
jgi:ABC-type glutathione transport system ATPase component